MADSKLHGGDLDTQTGAALATGDYFYGVDISNTSGTHSDANGNSVKMTAGELKIGLATTLGLIGIDKIFDAAGDLVIGTGADTSTRLAVSTSAGRAVSANPNDANKLGWHNPQSIRDASGGLTGSLASTFDRSSNSIANVAARTSGTLYLYSIFLPAGLPVTNITFWSGTTALATGANQWFALFDSSRNKLAITADDTSTAWASNASKTLAVTGGPYVTTTTGWFYLGYMVKATTMPSGSGATYTNDVIRGAAPITNGSSDTGLTNPASCPATAAAITVLGVNQYGEVS